MREITTEYRNLLQKYASMGKSIKSAESFYRQIRREGVTKINAQLLLQDYYQLDALECMKISFKCDRS